MEIEKNDPKEILKKIEDEKPFSEKIKRHLKIFTDGIIQAKEFIKSFPFFYDKNRIWWVWNFDKFCYEITDEIDLLNRFKDVDEDIDTLSPTIRQKIINALKQVGRKNVPLESKSTWIQFKDKIIDLETSEEFAADPKYFITNPIMWKRGEKEYTPAIDLLIDSWVGEEHKQELYEILAFCMLPNYFIHRMFCLIGSGANGKSTFLKILQKFIGEENLTSSSLNLLLKERFEGSKLFKKLVCLMGETNFNIITNTDFLKKLTGEDLVRAEFKGKNPFDYRNYAKLIMATNSLPPTADKTEGFYRRWKIIDFPNKFDKESDILINVLDEEYEALATKCFRILKDLWNQRIFTGDGDFDTRKNRYEDRSNPLAKFIKQDYEKDINGFVIFSEFMDEFNDYLLASGFRTLKKESLSKQLRNEGFDISLKTINKINTSWILGLKEKGGQQDGQGGLNGIEPDFSENL